MNPAFLTAIALSYTQAAEHRVVIEVNVTGSSAYNTVLDNAENLKRAFAPKPVRIEIVCHGRGLDMLFLKGNAVAARLTRDHKGGVEFMACSNTMRGRHVTITQLFPFVHTVDSGVAEVVRKEEQGWSYLKSGF